MGFVAEVTPKVGSGFKASAAFCARNNMSSLCPSLGPSPDATVSAPVLLFGRLSPTRRQEFPWSGRRRRAAQADLAGLLPGAGIAAHILRALRECRSGFATHGDDSGRAPFTAHYFNNNATATSANGVLALGFPNLAAQMLPEKSDNPSPCIFCRTLIISNVNYSQRPKQQSVVIVKKRMACFRVPLHVMCDTCGSEHLLQLLCHPRFQRSFAP
jgi:hypothetical protein